MANDALSHLSAKIKTDAAKGPITLTKAYLAAGLNDSSITVPDNIDADLEAAFQSKKAGLDITVQADKVSAPVDKSFDVTEVSAQFINREVDKGLTLTFSLISESEAQTLEITILTKPASWTWKDLSAIATGFPFNLTSISGSTFTFTASEGPLQDFTAQLTPPDLFKPVIEILKGLNFPTLSLPFKGSMDFSRVDGEKILLPTTRIEAPFSGASGTCSILFLKVTSPVFGLEIGPPEQPSDGNRTGNDSDDTKLIDQYIGLYFGTNLELKNSNGSAVIYQIRSYAAFNAGNQEAAASPIYPFNFSLGPSNSTDALLTPATIISVLADNQGSFFEGTPPQLQQFLGGVGLRGFSLFGIYNKTPQWMNIAVTLGADSNVINQDTPWSPFNDPTNGINFGITDFELNWSITKLKDKNQQSYLFQTSFILWPEIFRGASPGENGLFKIEFTSDMLFNASFDGKADINALIAKLSANLIELPKNIVEITVSDIKLMINVSAKSYQFNTGVDADLNLFTIGPDPALALKNGQLSFGAVTPTPLKSDSKSQSVIQTGPNPAKPQTTYTAAISGLVSIGPLFANADLTYNGKGTSKTWNISVSLAKPIEIKKVIKQFLDLGKGFAFPDFLPGTLIINALGIDAMIQTGDKPQKNYTLNGGFNWAFNLGIFRVDTQATLTLNYDNTRTEGQQYSGEVSTLWDFSFLNDKVLLGYSFSPDNSGKNAILKVSWEGLTATYSVDNSQLTFTLSNWSLGKLIQKLVQSIGNPYFTLGSPWDILNRISLDGLSLIINLKDQSGKTNPSIEAKYSLPGPIDLGFIKINGITFSRKEVNGKQKINLGIDGSSVLKDLTSGNDKESWDNLLNEKKGQPVDQMPNVPGRGNKYFNLPLLALGQRIAITGSSSFANTKAVIDALAKVPSTTGDSNPVNPGASGAPAGTPYYDRNAGWLIAAHLQLLKAGNDWTVDLMFVFNDPNLYGLRLAAAGAKAKALAGLVLDILYKKITDDVGVYQVEWTFPEFIRTLNFGAVSVTLPSIGVKIYTNGDFFIDIGFPYNMDFSRSFSFSVIVAGIPILGSGGVYFGKLSSLTATQVPATTRGTFDPVITFGLGMQVGLGYNFSMGPLKAGFALTVFGILEGTIAVFHAYQGSSGDNTPVQNDYYFHLKGTVGILGRLYGSIDFGIISASLNIKITLSLTVAYESYKPIPIIVRATVDVSLRVKIDLGLFSFHISLSFHADVSASFEIALPNQGTPPWADETNQLASPAMFFSPGAPMEALALPNAEVSLVRKTREKPVLSIYVTPQYTVMANQGETDYTRQNGSFVFLFSMDAPAANGTAGNGDTSLDRLCADYFPWLLGKLGITSTTNNSLAELQDATVSKEKLQAGFNKLTDTGNPPFSLTDLLIFLSSFNMTITIPDKSNQDAIQKKLSAGAMIFPTFDGISLSVPQSGDPAGQTTISFSDYVTADQNYLNDVAVLFRKLAAVVSSENGNPSLQTTGADDMPTGSLAAMIFTDVFMMIGRQLLQTGLNAFGEFAYNLNHGNKVSDILNWANNMGNALTVGDIVSPNGDFPLTGGEVLTLPLKPYTLQQSDTLARIATVYTDTGSGPRWRTTPNQLINANGDNKVVKPGVSVSLTIGSGPGKTVITKLGETFNTLAKAFGVNLSVLADQSALHTMDGILSQGAPLFLPPLAYKTASSNDTLHSVSGKFGLSIAELFPQGTSLNQDVPLFSTSDGKPLTLTSLSVLMASDIWKVVNTDDQISQISGMVSRFMLHGLRLPRVTDNSTLTLSSGFLYPKNQESYGLYQLTGQQFPTPASLPSGADYTITVSRSDTSHGVDLSFITIGAGGKMTLTTAFNSLSSLLDYARKGIFKPAPYFTIEPGALRSPNALPVKSYSLWASADVTTLKSFCQTGNTGTGDKQPQVQPILWSFPDTLIRLLNRRKRTLEAKLKTFTTIQKYMPGYAPYIVSTDTATHLTTATKVASYCYTTRVDFTVKKLPQAAVQDAKTPANPLMAMTYEVLAPSAVEAQALERLLTTICQVGEGIVKGLFLLMPQANAQSINLLSQGQNDFLAFLTQTNLSTETNPPELLALAAKATDETPAPRGILNTNEEFIRLLWELSTVRSGGYYLSYQDLVAGTGLPDAIFDESGTAVLTLVIAYDNSDRGLQGHLANFVNSFFTTDTVLQQGNSLSLQSESVALTSLETQASDSLASLADFYGIGAGRLAELNPSLALRNDAQVPVTGIIHLITPSEAEKAGKAAAKILANLATYYSVNATSAMTAKDIQDMNPGVTAAAGVALFIPGITYKISDKAEPGHTFSSLAAYYKLSMDAIAVTASRVKGLFADKTILNMDSQNFDSQSTFGQGNTGFSLVRNIPAFPATPGTDPSKDAEAYMYNLFSVLAAGVDSSSMFNKVDMVVPFGPQKPDDGSHKSVREMRDPKKRRKVLNDLETSTVQTYQHAMGLSRQATTNAAPLKGGKPDPDNPYKGVGSFAQVDLSWRDLFGNTTVTPFSAPTTDYKGALNNQALVLRYTDRLVGLDSWPQLRIYYTYDKGTNNGIDLQIRLELDTDAYQGGENKDPRTKAAKDLGVYQQIYYQLNQSYKDLSIPWADGNPVTVALTHTLTGLKESPLSPDQWQPLREYVNAVIPYLTDIASGKAPTPPPAQALKLPLSLADVVNGNILALSVMLTLSRDPVLVAPQVAGLAGGISVSSSILPVPDPVTQEAPGTPSGYSRFAATFEGIFLKTGSWSMRVGTGTADPGATPDGRSQTLWAVRFADKSGEPGISYTLNETPGYFAPKPISRSISSARVQIYPEYEADQNFPPPETEKQTFEFTGVDENVWFESFLKAVDDFLSPEQTPAVFLLDKLTGIKDPTENGLLGEVLTAKQTLSDSIVYTMLPILSSGPQSGKAMDAAKEKLRQALLNQLSSAYDVTASIGFEVKVSTVDETITLYGTPTVTTDMVTSASTTANQNYSFSTGRIPLNKGDTDSSLGFLFNSKNIKKHAYVTLGITYKITHLEHDITSVPGIDGYTQSNWISLISGPIEVPLAGGKDLTLPVVLRALPQPPTLKSQKALPGTTDPKTVGELVEWDYDFGYIFNRSAQDSVNITVEINRPQTAMDQEAESSGVLVTALAQFVTVFPAVSQALRTQLPQLDGKKPDQAVIASAKSAVSAFVYLVNQVTSAYKDWAMPKSMKAALMVKPQPLTLDFTLSLKAVKPKEGDDPVAQTDVLNVKLTNNTGTADALYDLNTGTISAKLGGKTVSLPAPVIKILPDTYEAVAVQPTAPAVISYQYNIIKTDDRKKSPMDYDTAFAEAAREIAIPKLDVFAHQSFWSSLIIERNLILFPESDISEVHTNKAFLFSTPEVRFSDNISPEMNYSTFDLDQITPEEQTVEGYLKTFFNQLGARSGGTTVQISMEGSYGYRLNAVPGLARTILPVTLMLPKLDSIDQSPDFISALAQAMDDWRIKNKVLTTGDAVVIFCFKAFAADDPECGAESNNQPPLLSIDSLTVTASKAPPQPSGKL